MTPTDQETAAPPTGRGPRGMALLLVIALLVAGGAVSYLGIRSQPLPAPDAAGAGPGPAEPVVRIELPHESFAAPPGPHRERFQVHCTVCHSLRLAFTQPKLPEKKWQEVVHKMIAVYGAPTTPDEEREIVTYLTAVHGPTPP